MNKHFFALRVRKSLYIPAVLNILLAVTVCAQPENDGRVGLSTMPGGRKDAAYIDSLYNKAQALQGALPDSAMQLFYEGLNLSRRSTDYYGEVMNLLHIAEMEMQRGNRGRALAWMREARTACRKSGQYRLWGNYYLYNIPLYNSMGYTDTAISNGYESLKLLSNHPEADSSERITAEIYTQLAMVYMSTRNEPRKAIELLDKALQIVERNNDTLRMPRLYNCLGGAWANSNSADSTHTDGYYKGLSWYFKGAAMALRLKDTNNLAIAYQNISGIYSNLKQSDSAEYYLHRLFSLPGKYISNDARIAGLFILGMSYRGRNEYAKAIGSYLEARTLARRYNFLGRMLDIEQNLAEAYEMRGQYQQAYTHLQAYTSLKDSLLNEEKINATRRMEVQYQTALKDKKLSRQQSQLQVKNTWIGAGALSTLMLACLLLVWRRNSQHRSKRQAARIRLMEQEQQLWKQDEEIRQLNATIKGEEKERTRIGRELHDGIVSQLVAVKMNLDTLQLKYPVPEEEHEAVLDHLEDIVTDLRKTAHNLIPAVLLEHGLVMALESYCEKTAGLTGLEINFVHQDMVPRLHTDFELSLYRMVQELIQNVIKHAQASCVLVQIDYHEPTLILTVEDNGKGIDLEQRFPEGVGLANMQSRIQALRGHIDIRAHKSKGTSVYLEFDLSRIQSLMNL